MLRRVALVRTDVSEEGNASFIRVARIGEVGITLAVTSTLRRNITHLMLLRRLCQLLVTLALFLVHCHPEEGGAKFLRNFGSYKSHTT
jgi:hypothetical protein